MKRVFLCFSLLLFSFLGHAQDKSSYEKRWYTSGTDTLPYRLLLPKDYNPKKKYPLILFLHGAGERGRDNEAQLTHGWGLFLRDSIRQRYPAVVVFPQCRQSSYWSNVSFVYDSVTKQRSFVFPVDGEPTVGMRLLLELTKDLQRNYKLNKKRLYVGGLSMGGMGTFELVRRQPKLFAAAFPICGGANTATASKLTKPSWWIFHGMKDDVVPPELSMTMAEALKAEGARLKLTLYATANHNSWDSAFAEPDLLPWLFSKHK